MIRPRKEVRIKRFSVDDYYKMVDAGILLECPHEEILDGILYEMPSSTPKKAAVTNRLNELFCKNFDDKDFSIHLYRLVRLDDFNELEPDFVFLKKREDSYQNQRPTAKDVLIVMEISDESIEFDKSKKLPLYAKFDIQEVWIVNLPKNIIEIHTKPNEGIYQTVKINKLGEVIKSEVIADLEIEVNKILG
jgi:Uma2 family endonuclease